MAEFVCNWCGKCCRSFGEFIRIERRLTDRDFYCRYSLTNDLYFVHVQPEYSDAFLTGSDSSPGSFAGEKKCPFLRKNPSGAGFACTVYPTRPSICREFRCYRMLIYDSEAREVGRVIGQHELRTTDENLARIWKEHVSLIPHSTRPEQDTAWLTRVLSVLSRHGYRGDPVA